MGFKILAESPTLRARARPCWRKQAHPSRGAADAHLRSMYRRRGGEGLKDADRLNVYQCHYCTAFHVGRRAQVVSP